jgi:hypothetical protein
MYCPYHGDGKRSASLNSELGLWNCKGCGRAGNVKELLSDEEEWVIERDSYNGSHVDEPSEVITETKIEGWHAGLLSRPERLDDLMERKGLNLATLRQYEIGWDPDQSAYTIPIRDVHGDIVNVRRYQLDVADERRKIWSVRGMGRPTLYPVDQLEASAILICEGEWDALIAIQNGIPAITRTGAADVWRPEWAHYFAGKRVFICHDADDKGQLANEKVAASLRRMAEKIQVVELPYPVTKKHGKDLGDFFVGDGHSKKDFTDLFKQAKEVKTLKATLHPEDPAEEISISVTDSFDPKLIEKPLRMEVTLTGKRVPSHLVPKAGALECGRDAGKRCQGCPMENTGYLEVQVDDDSPLILSMVDTPEALVHQMIATNFGIPKCDRVVMNMTEARTVEEIYVRPSIENRNQGTIEDQDFMHRRVYSTVTHNLGANQTVALLGTIRANPRNSLNEFQAWEVQKPENAMDSFAMTPEMRERLLIFHERDAVMDKLFDIASDQADSFTHIYGRLDLHVFMDLVWHSILHIPFGESGEANRGYLDALVMGDTRTGKSEIASRMIDLYGMGEMISCESATYAGVVGGLDRQPSGAWVVKWGAIPINDRRLVVLDEVSGLQPDQIAQMSSIRSSGIAEMTKIQSERAMARTRLVWLANPRDARMSDYTYGIYAIRPLVGNQEDISRFDMAMGVFSQDVASAVINRNRRTIEESRYGQDNYRDLLHWAWTRKAHHVKWRGRARAEIMAAATRMGNFYEEQPPLVQAGNIRVKLARIATAIAARTFSTDSTGNQVWVTVQHVEAAESFLNQVYSHPRFGYAVVSGHSRGEASAAIASSGDIEELLRKEPAVLRFMRSNPVLDKRTMESVLNMSSERVTSILGDMWRFNAVKLEGSELKVQPAVIDIIRGMEL